ncbi:MAG: KR domain-containing protein [Actinobacteria bacterium]|nr:KR domain-containing protein [Actinomycetota bacterium]
MTRRSFWGATALVLLLVSCSGDSGRSVEAFCSQLTSMNSTDITLAEIDLDDSDAVRAALESFADDFEQLAGVAPDEVAADAQTIAEFGRALAEAALAANPDDPFDRAALLAEASAQVDNIDRANDGVASYSTRLCTPAP